MSEISTLTGCADGSEQVPNPRETTDNRAESFGALPATLKNTPGIHSRSQNPGPDPARADERRPYHRCAESWRDGDDVLHHCTTVLPDGANCTVCGGRRCYQHCGAVDHLVSAGTAVHRTAIAFGEDRRIGIVELLTTGPALYLGHLAVRIPGEPWRVLVRDGGADFDEVLNALTAMAQSPDDDDDETDDDETPAPLPPEESEPDGDLPAKDAPPAAATDDVLTVDVDDLGLSQRHRAFIVAAIRTLAESLAQLPSDVLDALSVFTLADDEAETDALRTIFTLPRASHRDRQRMNARAMRIVRGAVACGCPDCRPIVERFGFLVGRGGM